MRPPGAGLLWDLLMRSDCCVSNGISSTWLLLNMNPWLFFDQISTCSGKLIWFPPCCRSSPSHPSLACAALISCSIPSLTTHTWTKSPTSVLQFGLSENNTVHRRPRISSTLLERGGQEKEWRQRWWFTHVAVKTQLGVCVWNSGEEEEAFRERKKKNDRACTVNTHEVLMYCWAAAHTRAYVLQGQARHEVLAVQTLHSEHVWSRLPGSFSYWITPHDDGGVQRPVQPGLWAPKFRLLVSFLDAFLF